MKEEAKQKQSRRTRQTKILRTARQLHRTSGISLFIFFAIISISGLLLGWKKNSNGYILPKTQQGSSSDLSEWLSLDSLQTIAFQAAEVNLGSSFSLELQRIDSRPNKGIVKFVFVQDNYGIQLDGQTGQVLSIAKRRSDLIENIHDGAILDNWFGTSGEIIKLIYTSIMGIALLTFTITGFWLWYGPKVIRKSTR